MIKGFSDYMKLQEGLQLNESVSSIQLSRLLATKDSPSKQYFRDIAKKDNFRLSDIRNDDIEKVWIFELSKLKNYLKKTYVGSRGTLAIKRKVFCVNKDKLEVVAGFVYDAKSEEISVEFINPGYDVVDSGIAKTFKSLMALNISLEWWILNLNASLNIDTIKNKELQKQLELVWKREFETVKKTLILNDENYKKDIINLWKEITKTSADISKSVIFNSRGQISFNGETIYYNVTDNEWGTATNPSIELSSASSGTFDPKKEPNTSLKYQAFAVIINAIIANDKKIDLIISLHKQIADNQQSGADFEFQHNGITWKRYMHKFVQVDTE